MSYNELEILKHSVAKGHIVSAFRNSETVKLETLKENLVKEYPNLFWTKHYVKDVIDEMNLFYEIFPSEYTFKDNKEKENFMIKTILKEMSRNTDNQGRMMSLIIKLADLFKIEIFVK